MGRSLEQFQAEPVAGDATRDLNIASIRADVDRFFGTGDTLPDLPELTDQQLAEGAHTAERR